MSNDNAAADQRAPLTPDMNWSYLHGGKPQSSALFKVQPEDFQVTEILGFTPDEDSKGQHHWLYIEKRGANTEFVAREIARYVDVAPKEVSYSGLKDRHAVTMQWFSVQLPATREVDWDALQHSEYKVLRHLRVGRKLRRGTHQANEFKILLRDVDGRDDLEQRLALIASQGVPNYYGEQRFGHNGQNLNKAAAMFAGKRIKDRNLRSMLLSSARSYIFNCVISQRIEQKLEQTLLDGDVLMLQGSNSFFVFDDESQREDIEARLEAGDVAFSAPLWGRGEMLVNGAAAEFERQAIPKLEGFLDGLERAGLKQERRQLSLRPEGFSWQWLGQHLELSMRLPTGTFATSVLRELVTIRDAQQDDV